MPRLESLYILLLQSTAVSKGVDHAQLEIVFAKKKILVLGMNVDEALAKFFQQGKSYRHIIDKGAALASSCQLTADNRVGHIWLQVVLFEERLHVFIVREIEVGLHHTFVGTLLQCLHICTLAKQQTDGTKDDAFACTRLASDD